MNRHFDRLDLFCWLKILFLFYLKYKLLHTAQFLFCFSSCVVFTSLFFSYTPPQYKSIQPKVLKINFYLRRITKLNKYRMQVYSFECNFTITKFTWKLIIGFSILCASSSQASRRSSHYKPSAPHCHRG